MGSAYSGLTKFGGYIQQYDWETLAKGIAGKQQQYDANYNAIQQKIDEIANLDLRPVDKQYLYNRLKGIIERVNNSGTLDLSKQGVSKQLNHDVVSAIDEKVLNGVAGMLSVKKYYKEVEFIKQKKPEQYNIYNDLYAQEKINKWYSNPNPGARFGGVEYVPYVDYKGKIVETLNKIKNLGDEAVIEVPTGDGYIVRKKVKELSPMDVRSIVTSQLSPIELKQMEIDGWAKYRAYDNKTLATIAERRIKRKLAQYKGQMSYIDNKLTNKNLTNAERELLLQEKSNLMNAAIATANEFKKLQNIVSANPLAARQHIYKYLEHEDTVDYAVGLYARKNTEVIYKADDAYWKYIDYKYKYDALSKKCCKSGKGDGDDVDDSNSGGDFLYVPLSTEVPEDDVNPFDKLSKDFVQTKVETSALGADIIKGFDIEESDELINKIKTDYNLDDVEAQWRIIQEQTNYGTDFSKVDAKRYFAFRDRYFDYETKKGTLDSIYNEVISENLKDVESKIIEALPESFKREYGIEGFDDIKKLDYEKKKEIYFSIVFAFNNDREDKDVAMLMSRVIGEELFGDKLMQVNSEYDEFVRRNSLDGLFDVISSNFRDFGKSVGNPGFMLAGWVVEKMKNPSNKIYRYLTMKLSRSMSDVVDDLDEMLRDRSEKYANKMPQEMAVSITDPELKGAIVAMAQAGKLITVEGKNLGGNLDKEGKINVYNKIITGNPKNILVTVTKGSSSGLKRVVLSNGSATAVVELPDSAFSNPNNNMVNSKLSQLVGKIDSGDYSPHRPWHLRASTGSFIDVSSTDDRNFAMITQTVFGGNKDKAQIITDTGAKRFLLMTGAPLTQFYYNDGKLYSQQQAIDPATNKVKEGFIPVQDILQKLPELSKNIVVDLKSDPQVGDVVVNYYYDSNGDGLITPEDTNIVSYRVDGGTAQKYVENLKRSPQLLALDLFGKVLQRQVMTAQQYVGSGSVESGIPVDKRFGLLVEKLNL